MSRTTTPDIRTHISEYNSDVRAEQCYFCPARHNLQTHHIVPQRKNGSDTQENLVIVCQNCHKKLETLYDKRFYERLGLTDRQGSVRSHYACLITDCTNAATLKIHTPAGNDEWFCHEHGTQRLDSDTFSLTAEVAYGVR